MKTMLLLAALAACGAPTTSAPLTAPDTAPAPAAPAFVPTAFGVKVSGAGRPVIFIPGLAAGGAVWDGTVAHLGGHVQAHVLTLAGFAGQPAIAAPFLEQVHDQIRQYIAANHLDHVVIVGHSLGGMMSLWLAETEPHIATVIDVDGMPFLAGVMDPTMTADKAAQASAAIRAQMAAEPHDQLVAHMKEFISGMASKPDDIARLDDMAAASDGPTVAHAFGDLLGKDLRPGLAAITAHVVIAAATENGEATTEQLKAGWDSQITAIRGVDLELVAHAKHYVMLDQPDAFYALVDKALALP